MPLKPASSPMGRARATTSSPKRALRAATASMKYARSRSIMLTATTRDTPISAARFQRRSVCTSTLVTALTTMRTPSTTLSVPMASLMKEASPGVSMRLILAPSQSRWAMPAEMVICRLISSSSWSIAVVPSTTDPRRFFTPVVNSMASMSEVFPDPRCPTTEMFLILAGSDSAMNASSPPRSSLSVSQSTPRASKPKDATEG